MTDAVQQRPARGVAVTHMPTTPVEPGGLDFIWIAIDIDEPEKLIDYQADGFFMRGRMNSSTLFWLAKLRQEEDEVREVEEEGEGGEGGEGGAVHMV